MIKYVSQRLLGVCLLGASLLPATSWAQARGTASIGSGPGPGNPAVTFCNLMPNGDFEEQGNPNPAGNFGNLSAWGSIYASNYYVGSTTVTSGTVVTPHSGNTFASVITAHNGGTDYTSVGPVSYLTNTVNLLPGRYYASFRAKLPLPTVHTPQNLGMYIGTQAASWNYGYSFRPNNSDIIIEALTIPAGNTWQKFSGMISLPNPSSPPPTDPLAAQTYSVAIGNLHASNYQQNYQGSDHVDYFVDDVQLHRLPEAGKDAKVLCNSPGVKLGGCAVPDATYQWQQNGTVISGATSSTLLVNPLAVTTYTLTVTVPGYPPYVTSASITPADAPQVSTGTLTICQGQTTTLSSTCASQYYSYEWSTGSTVVSTTYTASVAPLVTTTYKLVVTPTGGGASTTSYVTVKVVAPPTVPQLALEQDDCPMIARYQIIGFNSDYTYTVDNLNNLTMLSPQANPVSATFSLQGVGPQGSAVTGSFRLTASSAACGSVASTTQTVTFGPPTAPNMTTASESRPCHEGDNATWFLIDGPDQYTTYTINGIVGRPHPTAIGYGTAYDAGTEFAIKVSSGVSSGAFTITATRCGLSTTGETILASYCRSTTPSYSIYPNPATDEVLIQVAPGTSARPQAAASEIINMQLFDSYGKLRLEQQGTKAATMRLRVAQLPAGLYVVHILHGQQLVSSQRLQIKK